MTKWVSILVLVAVGGCSGGRPELTQDEAYRCLLDYHFSASEGLIADTASIDFRLVADGAKLRHAVNSEGDRLASFRWTNGRWAMAPNPRLTIRLRRIAQDRPQVDALSALVDSAEIEVRRFQGTLVYFISVDRGSEPWAWRLRQARDFLSKIRDYVGALRSKGGNLAGSQAVLIRIDDLMSVVEEAEERVRRELDPASGPKSGG